MNSLLNAPWCTYISRHPSGCWYAGKGKTVNVLAGTYKGSGVRFKLSLRHPQSQWETWTTTLLATFNTEEEAYAAEELLVTAEHLTDMLCLNMQLGGRKGKYKTHSTVLRSLLSGEKKVKDTATRLKRATRVSKEREKVRNLRLKLKQK